MTQKILRQTEDKIKIVGWQHYQQWYYRENKNILISLIFQNITHTHIVRHTIESHSKVRLHQFFKNL